MLNRLVLLRSDLNDHGWIVKAARRMRRKADRDDAGRHCLLVDLQELDPIAVRIGAFEAVDGAEAWLDLVMRPRQGFSR